MAKFWCIGLLGIEYVIQSTMAGSCFAHYETSIKLYLSNMYDFYYRAPLVWLTEFSVVDISKLDLFRCYLL